jgi:hypothetical protein
MSDLQAVLWYPEKRIYETAKIEESSDDQEGYADTAAPDYANAAAKLGVAQPDIDRVTRQVDSEKLSAGNGPGSARRNARGVGGQAESQAGPEAVTPAGAMFVRPSIPASNPAAAFINGLNGAVTGRLQPLIQGRNYSILRLATLRLDARGNCDSDTGVRVVLTGMRPS